MTGKDPHVQLAADIDRATRRAVSAGLPLASVASVIELWLRLNGTPRRDR